MKRHHGEEHEGGQERWLVSYADFITLMFAFFAVLYATSQKDMEKSKEFQDSIKKYLIKAGFGGASNEGVSTTPAVKNSETIEEPIPTFNKTKTPAANVVDDAEAFLEARLSKDERKKYILDLAADEWGVRVTIPSAGVFARGSDKFQPDAIHFLSKLAELVVQTKRKVLIEGHVAKGETGSYKSTWEFASARSVNMLRFIEKTQKVPSDELASASLGDSRPLEGDQALSSRLEVVLLNADMNF